MKPQRSNPQHDERIKRVLLAGILGLTPLTILFGLSVDWNEAEWLAAWTAAGMGTFFMVLFLFGVMPCHLPREKGQPKRKGGRK